MNKTGGIGIASALTYILLFIGIGINASTSVVIIQSYDITPEQLPLIFIPFQISMILFNFPSGMIADIIGKKRTALFGVYILAITFFVLTLSSSFWWFFWANMLGGIGQSFIFGAYDLLICEYTNAHENKNEKKVFASISLYSMLGRIIGSLAGGYLAFIGLKLPFATVSLLMLFTGIFITLKIHEHDHPSALTFRDLPREIAKRLGRCWNFYVSTHSAAKSTVLINITGILFNISWYLVFLIYTPYLKDISHKAIWILGHIGLAFSISMALGSIILKRFSRTTWLGPASFMIAGITLILIPFFGFVGAMILFFIYGIGRAVFEADRSGILGALVSQDNTVKTSLFSLDKVISSFFVAISYILIWQLGLLNHGSVVWILSGALLIPAAIITFMVESRVRKCVY